jgi:hypothetical protein
MPDGTRPEKARMKSKKGLKTREWKACGESMRHRGFEGEEVGRERGKNPSP